MQQHEIAPSIERVSDIEVWLLDEEGIRSKRICGKIRVGIPEEFPCIEDAGKETEHEGAGYCDTHDVEIVLTPKTRNTYEALVDPNSQRSVMDYLARTSQSGTEHHTSVDSEIELLEALIASLIKSEGAAITPKKADDIAKVAQKLGNLKKIKIETMKKEKLDAEVVGRFLKSVLGIIKMHSSSQTAKNIIMDIITNVAVPMMNREEMTRMDRRLFEKSINE